MFKGAIKDDLRLLALELDLEINDKMSVYELNQIIKNSDKFKDDPNSVHEIVNSIIETRKYEDNKLLELEQLKLERSKYEDNKLKNELELARIRAIPKPENEESNEKNCQISNSIDNIIKSIRTLTLKVPVKAEAWGYFFDSLERAFSTKSVPEKMKAEILLNLLGERATNIIIYLKEDELNNYEKVKEIVLREYQATPQLCLEQFKRAQRYNESHVQFASRLMTNFEYYLKLRNVSDFETLKHLIVSDKLYETLDKETASHILIRQSDSWFKPLDLGKEADLYFTSRGRSVYQGSNNFQKYRNTPINSKYVSKTFISEVRNLKCVMCSEKHYLVNCPNYLKLPVIERVEFVKNNKLCFNCLNLHNVASCNSKYSCFCKRRHNRTLHFPKNHYQRSVTTNIAGEQSQLRSNEPQLGNSSSASGAQESVMSVSAQEFIPHNPLTFMSSLDNKSKFILLSTAICYISDERGKEYKLRCLLDSGSVSSFITRSCAELMQLKRNKINIVVSGLNDASVSIKHSVNASVSNHDKNYEKKLELLVVPKITADLTPSRKINIDTKEFSNIMLADDKFNIPERIDMLLGAEVFYEILKPGQIRIPNSELILQDTVFGFIVSGGIPTLNEKRVHCGLIKEINIDETLKRFWELENVEGVEEKVPISKESEICEEHYKQTHMRDQTGRYIVTMPFKENPVCLGNSRDIALKRLNSLWKRLIKDPQYLNLYRDFLKEYEEMGHMKEITDSKEPEIVYYMPHHGVYRPHKSTTKLRVVFNASSVTSSNKSLNSIMHNGGVIQDDLFAIMVRFRKHTFVFTADIQKMYRMINVHPNQRSLQRIVWKNDINEPVKTYELSTVTYGTVCAPHLATRTLKQLSIDEGKYFPIVAPVLSSDFYMDDILTGSDSLTTAKQLQFELIETLKRAGMALHKWCSNNPELAVDNNDYTFPNEEETTTLGILWKSKKDTFGFKLNIESNSPITKRQILSTIARLFDPIGLLGPVITKAKIFLQMLWLLKLNWDDTLPDKECKEWKRFRSQLLLLNELEIERCILIEEPTLIELHGFADASEAAYGAVIYCKSRSTNDEVKIRLITSKSRVSPIKRITIPRLELNAAVLLAKLMSRVLVALKLDVNNVYYYSDSMITLSWLQREPCQLKTFVANRVATIQNLTAVDQWRHVASSNNPADFISRGLDPAKFLDNEMWFRGPTFLLSDEYPNRPIPTEVIVSDCATELKTFTNSHCSLHLAVKSFLHDFLNLSNNYTKLIRILSFIYRFCKNCKKEERTNGPLKTFEIQRAESKLIQLCQEKEFKREITCLKEKGNVSADSQLKFLHPFLDDKGILRVGGRLIHSQLSYNGKFPIVLPKGHKITRLIGEEYHKKYLHIGPQGLLFIMRQKFWPLNGRNLCRKIVHNCVICFKAKPVTYHQLMGNLPPERVSQNFPFNCVGIDFFGNFMIKYPNQRKGKLNKVYVCIFICLVTKACHLELVNDLSSDAFIAALKRFISRRGKCAHIFSDNATNFTGTNNELKRLRELVKGSSEKLSDFLSNEGIEWNFIPPRAPNHGGLWEAGVKSVKYHLKRVVGNLKLTYEEFFTVIVQIEGILNSRPLYPLSADINDYDVLTPAHFLIGRPITTIPEPNLLSISDNRLKIWQKLTKIIQTIWKRWSNNYLSTLQQRTKWYYEKDNLKIGTMVVLKEDNLPVSNWLLGRIVELFPGSDNKVRVVSIKTKGGIFKRPVTKLGVLPVVKD